MKTPPSLLTVLAAGSLLLAGCSKAPDPAASKDAGGNGGPRKIVIGFIGKSLTNDVFQAAQSGAQDAAKELGAQYHADIQIEIRTPNDEDATKQAEAVEALARRGVDGIAVSCTEANTLTPSIDQAVDKGVPVMCFDSDAPTSKRFAFYGTAGEACGSAIMKELARAMDGKGTVAILAGSQSALNLQKRVTGAREALKGFPQMKLAEPGVFYHVETPEKAAEAVQSAQNANPGIQGWALIGGWPLFTADALKWPAGSVKVVSCDALPAELNYLRDGHVEALYSQDCYGWGHRSVEILLEKIVNKQAPADPILIDPLTRVTKENVEEYAKHWDKWLGKK